MAYEEVKGKNYHGKIFIQPLNNSSSSPLLNRDSPSSSLCSLLLFKLQVAHHQKICLRPSRLLGTVESIHCAQVLTFMAPKLDRVYTEGHSKSVAPSARLVIGSDNERDPEYLPPGTVTLARAARTTRATPMKLGTGVATASQSEEERILTDTPSRSSTHSSDAFGCEEASAPHTASQYASSDEDDSVDSTPAPLTGVPAPIADNPNRWCVEGQFQVYIEAKLPND
ncbi:uncharacterized protein LOC107005397 [Solanum pennellii]|uniref:Uncharacterized protein LOC107005397 n=1 Tax=Solanum pennellii TaxID=28526 RepID=A0ABM1FNN6_SOLPN|nr:uncharacterized protein LOC107005397 [Solanum pennellii]XP_027769440.1 uncharacterized protein LOC107005397 [Solanum pennellii]